MIGRCMSKLINKHEFRTWIGACIYMCVCLKDEWGLAKLASHFEISVRKHHHRFGKYMCITVLIITCISWGWD